MAAAVDPAGILVSSMWAAFEPILPWVMPMVVLAAVVSFPMLGRGPSTSRRDPWRGFKYGARAAVLERADGRCEGSLFFAWGRCFAAAVEVDHVFPHSKGGPTVVSNGQALCKDHNRRKRDMTPPWWYVLALEKRRRGYFPADQDVRVYAVMTDKDVAARARRSRRSR
ncbi:HNH endonuclease [Demequina gelatinilytica]|uniref:HNH endonuclease n=1 Tax=Demequina gelatinilytica TaxID=1638980 RepID=UPI0012E068AA|nr:HNH endonuclease signature motif containing protein [Demequina gelatinilytica]